MKLISAATLALASLASTASAAINISSIVGTWSSGSGQILTGPNGLATDPINGTFTYPGVGGYSFSFTEDGFYEQAQITWTANGTRPDCIEATMVWSHGTWSYSDDRIEINTSSDIFSGDGRVQVQNACNTHVSQLFYYNTDGLFKTWAVSTWRGKTMLRLGSYDGSLLPRMYLVSDTPRDYMWNTTYLSNATGSA